MMSDNAPERLWIDALIVTTPSMRVLYGEPPPNGVKSIEYVRADLVAAAVRAAFQNAADYVRHQWLAAYPVEIFPEPPKPPASASRDCISAAMGRHMATKLIEHFEAAANTEEGGGDGA